MSQNYQVFGKYILLEKLNQGGMAEIYLAKTPSLGGIAKFLAIKRILPQYSDNADFIEMFKDEAKIAVNLVHSNIATIHEFGMVENLFYLAMTYVEGANLRQILNKMKKKGHMLSLDHIVYVVREVAAALDFAHRCLDPTTARPLNIIHRDMSPQNIMISYEGEVKIIDFGIAKAASQIETTRSGTLKGKLGYMSPEQAEGQVVDHRTDIFSLGIILWELLAGDRLFVANNEINTLRKVRECQVPGLRKINPNIPAELETICDQALARDRNLRYQSAADMHRDLTRFLNRQFPDFLPSDFRTFVKSLYSQEILESRIKLVEYSKVIHTLEPRIEDAITDSTSTISLSMDTSRSDRGADKNSNPALNSGAPKGLVAAGEKTRTGSVAGGEINFADLSIRKSGGLSLDALEVERGPYQQTHTYSTKSLGHTRTGYTVSSSGTRKRRGRSGAWTSAASGLSVTLILGLSVMYLFFPQKVKMWASYFRHGSEKPLVAPGASDSTTQASTLVPAKDQEVESPESRQNYVKILIESSPEGAAVSIDGEKTGLITPVTVPVPRSKEKIKITLEKAGYLSYSRYFDSPEDVAAQVFTLQKEVVGFISVQVHPQTGAKVLIDGQEIREPLPLTRYPIAAGTTAVVSAVNPFTGGKDQKTVRIEKDQQITIHLFPTVKYEDQKKRKPSNQNKKK